MRAPAEVDPDASTRTVAAPRPGRWRRAGVILLETAQSSYPETAQARHALYVGATRAAHQLWCTTSETPSKLVTDALTRPAQ